MRLRTIEDIRDRKRLYGERVAKRRAKRRKPVPPKPSGHFVSLGGDYKSLQALVSQPNQKDTE